MAAQRRRTAHETPLPPGRVRVQVAAEMPPESDYSSAACFRATYDGEPVKVTLRGVPTIVTLRRNLEAYGSCPLECNTWEMSLLTEADRRRIAEAQERGEVASRGDNVNPNAIGNVGSDDIPPATPADILSEADRLWALRHGSEVADGTRDESNIPLSEPERVATARIRLLQDTGWFNELIGS